MSESRIVDWINKKDEELVNVDEKRVLTDIYYSLRCGFNANMCITFMSYYFWCRILGIDQTFDEDDLDPFLVEYAAYYMKLDPHPYVACFVICRAFSF